MSRPVAGNSLDTMPQPDTGKLPLNEVLNELISNESILNVVFKRVDLKEGRKWHGIIILNGDSRPVDQVVMMGGGY